MTTEELAKSLEAKMIKDDLHYARTSLSHREKPSSGLWDHKKNRPVPWSVYQARARQTAQIDYKCQFVDGKCNGMAHWSRNKMGCCRNCKDALGYLGTIPIGTTEYYMKRYDPKTGFWREGKGCILPRHRRSFTCLAYACDYDAGDTAQRLLRLGKLVQIQEKTNA